METSAGIITVQIEKIIYYGGVATETEVTKPLFLFAEVFGRERGHPIFHFGFWYWIVPERLQINAAYGNRFGTPPDGYFFSVGFTLFTVPFLP